MKAAMVGRAAPYSFAEQDVLAKHFTEAEDAANKVERQVAKSAAAMFLESRLGEQSAALVTGASAKGTWARLLTIPVEGRVVHGSRGPMSATRFACGLSPSMSSAVSSISRESISGATHPVMHAD